MAKVKKLRTFTKYELEHWLEGELYSYEHWLRDGDHTSLDSFHKPITDEDRRLLEHRFPDLPRFALEARKRWAQEKSDKEERFKKSENVPIRVTELIGEDSPAFCRGRAARYGLPLRDHDFQFNASDLCEWVFKGWSYEQPTEKGPYGTDYPDRRFSDEEIQLLILEEYDKERRKFEQLKRKFLSEETKENSNVREPIPESVRIAVWRRDDGKCVKCGSREKLEYDHIIPVSQGGGNTARNIELLCEKCNREKSNKIQ